MSQRNALIVATALTVFVLVIVGGIIARVAQGGTVATPTAVPSTSVVEAASPTSQADQQALQGREAAYQQTIEQANQQLQQAYAEQQALREQLSQAQAAVAPVAPIAESPFLAASPNVSSEHEHDDDHGDHESRDHDGHDD